MNSFRNNRPHDYETPLSTVWLLNDIAESRDKQELFTRQSPQALKALRDTAVIQSTGTRSGCALAFFSGIRVVTLE